MWRTLLAGNAGPKKSPSGHRRTTLSGYIFATKACIDNLRKLVTQQYLPHMSPQYGELSRLAAEIGSLVWGTPMKSTGFASWQHYCTCTVLQQWSAAKLCGVEQRAPPIVGRVTTMFGIGPHSSLPCVKCMLY